MLERRLNDLVCIFCEKIFKNRDVLKEHMRKKSHKKINPRNEAYDKFYIVNYLEFGRTWSGQRKQVLCGTATLCASLKLGTPKFLVLITRPNPVPSMSLTSNALEDRNSKDIQDLDRDLDPLEDREDLILILSL